jgi:hypothetical protein
VLFKKDTPSLTRVKSSLGKKATLEATTSEAEEELASKHSCAETVNRPSSILTEDVSRVEGLLNNLVSSAEQASSALSTRGSANEHGLAFKVASSGKAEPINMKSGSPKFEHLIPSSSVKEEVEQELISEMAASRAQGLDTCPLSAEEKLSYGVFYGQARRMADRSRTLKRMMC